MQLTDIKNPDERKKLLWAIVLGLVAIVFLSCTGSYAHPARLASAVGRCKRRRASSSCVAIRRPIQRCGALDLACCARAWAD